MRPEFGAGVTVAWTTVACPRSACGARGGTAVALTCIAHMTLRRALPLPLLLIAFRANAATPLVAGADELYALRDGAVVTLDGEGRAIRRCGALDPRPERDVAPSRPLALDAEDVLRLAGLPDDDTGSTDAEDLLRDEGFGRTLRARNTPAAPAVRALAADPSANQVWIATTQGLFRGDRHGCIAAGLSARELALVAVAGSVVAAASDRLLWRADLDTRIATQVTGLASRPRALAVSPTGFILVGDDEGILEVGPTGNATRLLDRPTDALVVCHGTAVALTADALYAWTPGATPIARGPRMPARHLACGRTPAARVVATGVGVWTSADGIDWTETLGWVGRDVGAAAALGTGIWLVAEGHIVALDSADAEPGRHDAPLPPPASRLDTSRWLAPRFPWPEVALLFAGQQTPQRFGWAVELVVAFPLGRRGLHRADRRPLALELVRRDDALAAAAARLSSTSGDEAAARMRALMDERDALR